VLEFGAGMARTPGSGGAGLWRVLAAHAMARWPFGRPGDRAWSGHGLDGAGTGAGPRSQVKTRGIEQTKGRTLGRSTRLPGVGLEV
jgi:hypothetical protein